MDTQTSDIHVQNQYNTDRLAELFELENWETSKYRGDLERLEEWAKKSGAKNTEDVEMKIKELHNEVGTPPLGNLIKHLSQCAYLQMERSAIDKKIADIKKLNTHG